MVDDVLTVDASQQLAAIVDMRLSGLHRHDFILDVFVTVVAQQHLVNERLRRVRVDDADSFELLALRRVLD